MMSQESILITLLFIVPIAISGAILQLKSKQSVTALALASSFSVLLLVITGSALITNTVTWNWISIGKISIEFVFEFNSLTIPLSIAVAFISLLVNIYSIGFFNWDSHQPRYYATLGFFTTSMIGLVISGNLLQTFVFWELVGVSSYLLISFYRYKPEAAQAGTKALIMNKVGDAGFIIALMAILSQTGTLTLAELGTVTLSNPYSSIVAGGLLIAAFSKSAQFPFYSWLPSAMEGPTPISALIHSATMVAAGVYLLIRVQFLIPTDALSIITVVGLVTAIISGLQSLKENELKRILAWSTVSQLGLMTMVIGQGGFSSAYIHLMSHAVFKSGLFLMAGILISGSTSGAVTDLSKTKKSILIIASSIFLVLSIMGIPLTIGFLSKEYLLSSISSNLLIGTFFLINLISILYSTRLLSLVYPLPKFRDDKIYITRWMIYPVLILSICSLWIFYSLSPFTSQLINSTWNLNPPSTLLTILSIAWSIIGLGVGLYLIKKEKIHTLGSWIPSISMDKILSTVSVKPVLYFSSLTQKTDTQFIDKGIHGIAYTNLSIALIIKWLDQNLVDGIVNILGGLVKFIGNLLRQFVAGKIQGYIWWTLVTLTILFIISRV